MDSPQDERPEAPEPTEEVSKPQELEEQQAAAPQEPEQHRPRAEEALAAMRADLREEEVKAQAGARGLRGLVQRLFRRKRRAPVEDLEAPSRLDALQFPEPPPPPPATSEAAAEEAALTEEPKAAGEVKPGFETMVRDRLSEAWSQTVQREPLEMEPPAPVEEEEPEGPAHSILTTLRQQTEEPTQELEPVDFRQEALEDYVVATDEEEEEQGAPGVRRLRTSWRYMRPAEKRLLIGALLIVALAMLAGSGFLVVKSIPTPTPVLTPTPSVIPIPISVSLPGGWVFPLNIGYVDENGKWNPKIAEWLSGTEVCRWVSLPWTVQLEAVVRTLKADDEIHLSMSNFDSIAYKVKSIEQVPSDGIKPLCGEGPHLLLILSSDKSDSRWVVTAMP